jgi:ParB-like chromosome segregation protein Spo0J
MKRNPLKEQPIPAGLGKILLAHLIPDAKNPRKDLKKGDPEFEKINKSVEKFGQLDPIIFNTRTRKILGGHQRLKVLDSQGYTELYTVTLGAYTWAFAEADLKELSEKEENAANIALNKAQGDWNVDQLVINLQELKLDDMLEFTGFDEDELNSMIDGFDEDPTQIETPDQAHAKLADKFIVPPFSVLDTRQGYWQERKRAWIALGIKSELGRGGGD